MILNLTQHLATADQVEDGVIDLPEDARKRLVEYLTVDTLPSSDNIAERCDLIAMLALQCTANGPDPSSAMIGGAPWMMRRLEDALFDVGILPVYSFSVRESEEQALPDGSVRKVNVFKHAGFIADLLGRVTRLSIPKEIDRLTSERNNAEMREYKMLGHANAANKRLKAIESTMCEVLVSVAVSDSGITECCIVDSGWVQQQQKHKAWMEEKRESKRLWGIKTFRVNVPMPLTFEDMTSD